MVLPALAGVVSALEGIGGSVVGALSGIVPLVQGAFSQAYDAIKTVFTKIYDFTINALRTFYDWLKNAINRVFEFVSAITPSWLQTTASSITQSVTTTFGRIWDSTKTALTTAYDWIKNGINRVLDFVKGVAPSWAGVGVILGGIGASLGRGWQGVIDGLKSLLNALVEFGKSIAYYIYNFIISTANRLAEIIKEWMPILHDYAKRFWDYSLDMLKGYVTSISDDPKKFIRTTANIIILFS